MKSPAVLSYAAMAACISGLAGCATPAGIPTGNWSGRGTYVDYEGVLAGDGQVPKERAKSRTYETMLSIRKARAFGREALLFYIHSKRGELFNVGGQETTMQWLLVKLRTLENGSTLYAVFDRGGVKSAKAATDLPPKTLAQATSIPTARGVILQLYYHRPGQESSVFTDTFYFLPGHIIKTGTYGYATGSAQGDKRKLVCVWWAEELHPTR